MTDGQSKNNTFAFLNGFKFRNFSSQILNTFFTFLTDNTDILYRTIDLNRTACNLIYSIGCFAGYFGKFLHFAFNLRAAFNHFGRTRSDLSGYAIYLFHRFNNVPTVCVLLMHKTYN